MESKIRVLTEHTINQIAAGEVIENPSSVVKELMENSLDAHATEICVEIKGGGRQLIRITDNGCGMTADDAVLCLERHATSKIKRVEDILEVGTMGFRGEAVPSIASISKFTLLTCPQGEELGTMVIVDGGKLIKTCAAACSGGTTIEVKSLFFNVPVRKKFQRSPTYDANEIHKVIMIQSLAHPSVSFKLINNGKVVLQTTRSDKESELEKLEERIGEVLGPEIPPAICPIDTTCGDYHISGYIGLPHLTRHNRTGQYLFVNKRAVFNHVVSYAVRDGYGTALSTNRHPVFVLRITMPGPLVDVNVHPQKREVRLRQEHKLREALGEAVQGALQKTGCSDVELFPTETPSFADLGLKIDPMAFVKEPVQTPPLPIQKFVPEVREEPLKVAESPRLFEEPKPPLTAHVLSTIPKFILTEASAMKNEDSDGLCFVDQRAAHSRIIYEKILSQSESGGAVMTQQLLIPYTFHTTPHEAAQIKEFLEEFNRLGIILKEFGPNTYSVDALPEVFGKMDIGALLSELTDKMRSYQDHSAFEKELHKQVALAASRAAVSSAKKLTVHEGQSLVNQLMQCESPYQCPLGKPTMVHISGNSIAKQFQKRS